ncbi:MAG: pentapeptide repeat-containing protein [Xenococcus sp. MO_188.B8]|nr:pentapeptide repeat-containing protein [Xenococcus sp. MO_188.B8]
MTNNLEPESGVQTSSEQTTDIQSCDMESPNSENEFLEERIKQVQLEKLEAERDDIKYKMSEAYKRHEAIKTYGTMVSALAGIAAIGTLAWSVLQGVGQIQLQREERTNTRIERAIGNLNSESSNLKLYGVSALRIVLSERHSNSHEAEILSAVAHAIATEKDVIVRDAMISLISSLSTSTIDKDILMTTLKDLVRLSQSMVEKENLWDEHQWYFSRLQDGSAEARIQSLAEAINILIRRGVLINDLSGIYCAYCDFTGLSLKELDFTEAILHGADFSESNLSKSVFDHTILEGSKFVRANLSGAKFTDKRKNHRWAGSFAYHRLDKSGGSYQGPDFSCADLSNADFSDFPIFILASDKYDPLPFMNKIHPSFTKANLSNTNFENANLLLFHTEDLPPFSSLIEGSLGGLGHIARPLKEVPFEENTRLVTEYYNRFTRALVGFHLAFSGSSWKESKMPKGISEILHNLDSRVPVFDSVDVKTILDGQSSIISDSDLKMMKKTFVSTCKPPN